METFKKELRSILKEAALTGTETTERPIRVFSQDESRFGLITIQRRRITLRGVKPIGSFQQVFKNFYIYGAVEPATGASFFWHGSKVNSEQFGDYLKGLSEAFPDSLNLLLVDNGRFHLAKSLPIPENVRLVFLPPYSPELNPIERVWQTIKDPLGWENFEALEPLQERVQALLSALTLDQLQSLTGYHYILQALSSLC